jgi:UDP-N-acetylglucosamine 1-carboxyvinyltransferase
MEAIPDRIEAGSFLVAGAASGTPLTITHCNPGHLSAVILKLQESGAEIDVRKNSITVSRKKPIRNISITTSPYPGFPTDMQAQFMSYLALGKGASIITDTIYTDRFSHVAELERLGAKIHLDKNIATVEGVSSLSGAHVMATDLRASAALVIAGLVARGETHLHRIYHIDRGYEQIEKKLQKIGAEIKRVPDELPY